GKQTRLRVASVGGAPNPIGGLGRCCHCRRTCCRAVIGDEALVDGSLKSLRGRPGSAVQIKGTVLIDAIQSLKQRRGQQVFEHVVASLEQPFRALLSDVVYPMAWYPLEGLTAFVAAGLCLSGEPEGQLVQRAEAVVEQQLRGIYRIFIKL